MSIPAAAHFHFATAMKASIERAAVEDMEDDFGPLFSHSPLTTPENSPTLPSAPLPPLCPPPASTGSRPHPTGSSSAAVGHPSKRVKTEGTKTEAQTRRKQREREKARMLKQSKKDREKREEFSHHRLRPEIQEQIIDKASSIHTPMDLSEDARVTSTGYAGLADCGRPGSSTAALKDLVGPNSKYGFRYVAWDGISPQRLVSADGYICGVLAGVPDPKDWPRVHAEACAAMDEASRSCQPSPGEKKHRRGKFIALRRGVSHGQGNTAPANHRNNAANTAVLDGFNGSEAFQRLSGFATSVMASWAPDMHAYYAKTLQALHEHDPHLRRNFPDSVFADNTYNLGPYTVCKRHTDCQNIACGWCAITAIGSYDHKLGGHLVLWDLELVIEFPPGSTILIPSAIVAHSNTAIQKGERRYSYTQYTSAGLFRWVENGFRNDKDLSEEEKEAKKDDDAARWEFGLSLTPRYQDS